MEHLHSFDTIRAVRRFAEIIEIIAGCTLVCTSPTRKHSKALSYLHLGRSHLLGSNIFHNRTEAEDVVLASSAPSSFALDLHPRNGTHFGGRVEFRMTGSPGERLNFKST